MEVCYIELILVGAVSNLKSFLSLKSEVAIASLFCQTKQPKTFLLQVKTIKKSPRIGITESVKSCNLHQKGSFKA
jgi:hypothetical protein